MGWEHIDWTRLPQCATTADLPSGADEGLLYVVLDDGDGNPAVYEWDGSAWTKIADPDAVTAAAAATAAGGVAGFADAALDEKTTTLAFDAGTRTFSIAPKAPLTSFSFYVANVEYSSTGDSVVIADTSGLHWIYYDGATLKETTTFSKELLRDYQLVAAVGWNATEGEKYRGQRETHGFMAWQDHLAHHNTDGSELDTSYSDGLGLYDFTIGDGSADSHAKFSVRDGALWDEDLKHVASQSGQTLAPLTGPVLYLEGNPGVYRVKTADAFPVVQPGSVSGYAGTTCAYNKVTAGTWSLAAVTNNKFFLVHQIIDGDWDYPVATILGQAEYSSISAAREGARTEIRALQVLGLATPEQYFISTVIYQTNSGYANAAKAKIVQDEDGNSFQDWRTEGANGAVMLPDLLPAQASEAEVLAGEEDALRSYSPALLSAKATFDPAGLASGEYVGFSFATSSSLTAGLGYYMKSDGTWAFWNATDASKGADALLGIAVSATLILLDGWYHIPATSLDGSFVKGQEMFMSTTNGKFASQANQPSAAGNALVNLGRGFDTANVFRFRPNMSHGEL